VAKGTALSKTQMKALTAGKEWIDLGANILLFWPPGVGKSHLVAALGHTLSETGRRVIVTRCSDLV
jgi:DNA replication protein DnaC